METEKPKVKISLDRYQYLCDCEKKLKTYFPNETAITTHDMYLIGLKIMSSDEGLAKIKSFLVEAMDDYFDSHYLELRKNDTKSTFRQWCIDTFNLRSIFNHHKLQNK